MNIKLILKGILFYITFLLSILFAAAIDSIYDNGYFLLSIFVLIFLGYTCYTVISPKEFNKILCYEHFI